MKSKSPQLPPPTERTVKAYISDFDNENVVIENALCKLFGLFPENTIPENVLLKVVAVNGLYRTGIIATDRVAEHIIEQKIDSLLNTRSTDVVDKIARVKFGSKSRNNYSFATKYCSWHVPTEYPIYDSFIEQMLCGYQKQDNFSAFRCEDLWIYSQLKKIMNDFRQHYSLQFSFKDIDKFLWKAGKEFYPPSWQQASDTASKSST